jgi:hypothetical protein
VGSSHPSVDDLDADIDRVELERPGYRVRIENLAEVVRATTGLWRRREELGLAVDEIVRMSGLSLDEVEAIENNAIDTRLHDVARYAGAVGLRLDLRVTAA